MKVTPTFVALPLAVAVVAAVSAKASKDPKHREDEG